MPQPSHPSVYAAGGDRAGLHCHSGSTGIIGKGGEFVKRICDTLLKGHGKLAVIGLGYVGLPLARAFEGVCR